MGKAGFSTRLLLPPCALFEGQRVAKHTNFQIIYDTTSPMTLEILSLKAAKALPSEFPNFKALHSLILL